MTPPILHDLLSHATALRALARELVGDAQADDVLQEAAMQSMVKPPAKAGPTAGWLKQVVRNVASKQRRAERTRQRYEAQVAPAIGEPADRSAEDADTMRAMTEAVTSLPDPYRRTILMRYLREMTPKEIAAATKTPVSTVKTRLQRGLELLREKLEQRDTDWRAALGAAFATPILTPSTGTVTMTASNKFLLTFAVLLPVALFAWWQDDPVADAGSASVAETNAAGTGNVAAANGTLADAADPVGSQSAAATASTDAGSVASAMQKPLQPFMRLDLVGPAAFRRAFAPTNLGKLMASADGEKLWRPLVAPLDKMWAQLDQGSPDFRASRERVLAYAGRVRVLWLMAPDGEGHERMCGVFALDMDDHTDFAALAGDVARPLQNAIQAPPTNRKVEGREVSLLLDEEEVFLSLPMVIDRQLVAFFGEGSMLEVAVTQGLAALANDVAAPQAPVSFEVDIARLVRATDVLDEAVPAKLFGLESLSSLSVQLRPDQGHVEVEATVAWGEGQRGVFAGLFPDVADLPKIRTRVPPQATPWFVAPVRPDVIFDVIVEAAGLEDDGGVEGVRASIHEELGMHIDDELLDHLGGDVMVLGDLWEKDDYDAFKEGEDLPLGGCVAFSVKNADAFQRGLDKVLLYLKRHVRQSEVREVNGVKITKLGSVFVTGLHMAVGKDLFALAIGEESVAQLEALVTTEIPVGEPALPTAALQTRHLAPAGWNALGITDLRALLGGQVGMALEMLDNPMARAMGFDFAAEETQAMMDSLLPLIKRHALGDLVTMAGFEDNRWRLRLVW